MKDIAACHGALLQLRRDAADFSKTAASGSSAGAGVRSGLLELTVCLC